MKIFVTGATGFIGVHVCRELVQRGHSVVALLRSPEKAKLLPDKNVEYLDGDLSIFKNPDTRIPECDVVVHLAAGLTVKDQGEYNLHYTDTVDLVECLKTQGWTPQRFVFASTLAAGGPSRSGRPNTEEDEPRPVDMYGKSKLKAEQYLAANAPFPTTAFRPGPVFGPGDNAALVLYKIASTGFGFRIAGNNQKLCFIHVADLAEAIATMAEDDAPGHKIYYVTSNDYMDTDTLWNTIGEALGKKITIIKLPRRPLKRVVDLLEILSRVIDFDNRFDKKKYRQMLEPSFQCSSEKLTKDLGWHAKTDLKTTTRDAAESYKREGKLK